MTTNPTGQEALIERAREVLAEHLPGCGAFGGPVLGKITDAMLVFAAKEAIPEPTRLREGLRDQIKSILNSHAFESFRIAGAAAFIPQHPGPAADAILSLLSSSPNKGEG